MVKTDFFSSPAYRVPPIRIVRCAKWTTMNVPDWVPCSAGSACSSGACSTVQAGADDVTSEGEGRRHKMFEDKALHAFRGTKRPPNATMLPRPADKFQR